MNLSIRRTGFALAALLPIIGACSDGGPTDTADNGLRVEVEGLPAGVAASITVTGPGSYSRALTGSEELVELPSGTYRITAAQVTSSGVVYGALQPTQDVQVSGSGTRTATVRYADASTGLSVQVQGLPAGATAVVDVAGPGGFAASLTSGGLLPGLAAGTYLVSARGVVAGDSTYQATPVSQEVVVTGDSPASVSIAYGGVARRSLNLNIATMYLVQSIQTREGAVPLVADRDAFFRVFAVASEENRASPDVRVRLFDGTTPVAEYLVEAGRPSVATSVDQGTSVTSWNVRIPGELIQPGLSVLAEVDPGDGVVEANEADNRFPASGAPQALVVHELPPLRLRLVPIHQSTNDRTGALTPANADSYLSLMRKLLPIGEFYPEVREVYTTQAQPLDAGGNVWAGVVAELDAVRVAEAGDPFYYYGVVNPPYNGGGVVGIANGIPSRTSLGWDRFPDAPETLAHELGHNFGRRHAPCGGAGGSDPEFPYPQGLISNFGMDIETGEVKGPNGFTDIMGYCDTSWWISDYTFSNILHYRKTADAIEPRESSLLVWGRVGADELVLEPAFRVKATPTIPRAGGDYRLEGLDASGGRLFSYSFAGSELGDGPADVRTFAFALPGSAIALDRLATLRLSGQGRSVTMQASADARGGQRGPIEPFQNATVRRAGADELEIRWNASEHPMVMVRDPSSGSILSMARGGEAIVRSTARELDLVYSDGVSSVSHRVQVAR